LEILGRKGAIGLAQAGFQRGQTLGKVHGAHVAGAAFQGMGEAVLTLPVACREAANDRIELPEIGADKLLGVDESKDVD